MVETPRLVQLGARRDRDIVTLGVAVVVGADGKLPSEVRIFRAGVNETEKGPYLFDDEAARSVIDHFNAHGVRLMIDLEHLSLDEDCPNYDPDPRAWCKLATKPAEQPVEGASSDLWIVGLEWLEDGVRRLNGKLQPYLSPAFPNDADRRILFVRNVAMTAMPATHDAPALIAASSKGRHMDPKQLLALLAQLCPSHKLSARALNVLADAAAGAEPTDGGGEAPAGKWATVVKTAQAAADALKGVQKVKDPDEAMALAQAAQKAVDDFEKAFAALTGGSSDDAAGEAAAAPAAPAAPAEAEAKMRAQERELTRLRGVAAEHEQLVAKQAAERLAAENGHKRELVGQLVVLGALTPGLAWEDDKATTPKSQWAKLSVAELDAWVKASGGSASRVPSGAVRPPAEGSGSSGVTVSAATRCNISEFEVNRLRATMDRERTAAQNDKTVAAAKFRSFDATLERYAGIKEQQLRGAEEKGDRGVCERLSRGIRDVDVLTTAGGGMVRLASVGVVPIAQMGPSTQRALEEFRLEFNTTLVSLPIPWAEDIGLVLPGGGLKTTFPLSFYAITYREQKGENPPASTPNSVDVTVFKKLFSAAHTAQLKRITEGDFAYIQTWGQSAAVMARDRVNMRNRLIKALLTDADGFSGALTGYWGKTQDQATGIDGQPFFSATHKVNPFDPKMKFHGAATWGNYAATAYPLSETAGAGNLTKVKALMLNVPGPDGNELGSRATGLLNPTCLDERARLLLTVQDLILRGGTVDGVANAFGQVKNEHYQSGFEHIWAPQLDGTDETADWYCYSRETIARGLPPWVLAEDAAEEVRVWDENSDFYKNSGFIKTGSYVYVNAALLYPHGIRLVKGA